MLDHLLQAVELWATLESEMNQGIHLASITEARPEAARKIPFLDVFRTQTFFVHSKTLNSLQCLKPFAFA